MDKKLLYWRDERPPHCVFQEESFKELVAEGMDPANWRRVKVEFIDEEKGAVEPPKPPENAP